MSKLYFTLFNSGSHLTSFVVSDLDNDVTMGESNGTSVTVTENPDCLLTRNLLDNAEKSIEGGDSFTDGGETSGVSSAATTPARSSGVRFATGAKGAGTPDLHPTTPPQPHRQPPGTPPNFFKRVEEDTPPQPKPSHKSVRMNLPKSDADKIYSIVAPDVINFNNSLYAIFSMKIPMCYDPDHVEVSIHKQKATLCFRRPRSTMQVSTICDTSFGNSFTIIHAAVETFFERRRRNKEDHIKNNLVLHLPFEAEPQVSNDLLTSGGFQNVISSTPDGGSSRTLVLTFKKKSTNFTSSRAITDKQMSGLSSKTAYYVKRSSNKKRLAPAQR